MKSPKYKIKELANGRYLLEQIIPDSKHFIHVDDFPTFEAATNGMNRIIKGYEWYFNEKGLEITRDKDEDDADTTSD